MRGRFDSSFGYLWAFNGYISGAGEAECPQYPSPGGASSLSPADVAARYPLNLLC